jgi:16S rRNA (uracil1498-N3)-methyltransferase
MNRAPCFFDATLEILTTGSVLTTDELSQETQQHLRSHRLREGEDLCFLNGQGRIFHAQTQAVTKKGSSFKILRVEERSPLQPRISLYLSPPLGSALEETLIQACELGVAEFVFVRSQHNQYKRDHNFRLARLERILESACAQCTQAWKPTIYPQFLSLEEAVARAQECTLVVADEGLAGREAAGKLLERKKAVSRDSFALFVGPEGGWSAEETTLLQGKVHYSLSLGELILRVPTAVVAAIFCLRTDRD